MRTYLLLALVALGCDSTKDVGTFGDDAGSDGADAAVEMNLTGVYACTIEAMDGQVACGGPAYTTNLSGQGLSMNVTQTDGALQAGIWGLVLEGALWQNGTVDLEYRDTECYACGFDRPFIIELGGAAADNQIRDIDIHMYQLNSGYSDCDKYYAGTCARN
jgi:hypothetical protein